MKYPLDLKVLDIGFQCQCLGEKKNNGWEFGGVTYRENGGWREIEGFKFHLKETHDGFVFVRGEESDMDELAEVFQ